MFHAKHSIIEAGRQQSLKSVVNLFFILYNSPVLSFPVSIVWCDKLYELVLLSKAELMIIYDMIYV